MWFLESINIITEYQSGCHKNRSTTDQVVRLESYIHKAVVHCEHVVSVFFDLEKAFDTTWKYGILWHDMEVWNTSWSAWSPDLMVHLYQLSSSYL